MRREEEGATGAVRSEERREDGSAKAFINPDHKGEAGCLRINRDSNKQKKKKGRMTAPLLGGM